LLLSLQAFDAAVRLQSFKGAASALHLTPSAISHRIRNLEMMVGGPLFKRKHRAVQVTAAGRALAAATGRAFAELLRAAEPLTGAQATARLRLSVSPLFASAWLMPRLPSFMAGHPEIELVIESSLQVLDFDSDAVHAGVRVGDGNWPGLATQRLMDLHATPVVTPALAKRLKLERPADVVRAPMIHVSAFPLAWPEWLRQAGAGEAQPRQTVRSTVSRPPCSWPNAAPAWHWDWRRCLPNARRRDDCAGRCRNVMRREPIGWCTGRRSRATRPCALSSAG